MRLFLLVERSAVACVLFAAAALGVGAANAAGPDYSGQTYADASKQISRGGSTPVIASVVGDQLSTDDCMVESSSKATNLDSSGRSRGSEILLHLNCNQALAAPGKPGNSAASPGGQKAKQQQERDAANVRYLNAHPAYCTANAADCKEMCDKAGGCSDEVLQTIG
ncbi:hypothetical protein OG976_09500 [Mycobacterium sp. NBC_00419]|uniref:hypothetical protein n=1 Tax=Mycobacterium sp. NBC_00419 TaxID=2975989 RepID=UPI002E207F43